VQFVIIVLLIFRHNAPYFDVPRF